MHRSNRETAPHPVHLHRWMKRIHYRLFPGSKHIRFRMRMTAPSFLHSQETIHSQKGGINPGDLYESPEHSAGCCCITSFHWIDIVTDRMDRLTLRSLLSHDLKVIWTYRRRTVIHRSAFWYRWHTNTVPDAGRSHLGERQKGCSQYMGERRDRIGWLVLSYEHCPLQKRAFQGGWGTPVHGRLTCNVRSIQV
jgi:hypothetical protein